MDAGDVTITVPQVLALLGTLATLVLTGTGGAWAIIRSVSTKLDTFAAEWRGEIATLRAETHASIDTATHEWRSISRQITDLATRAELEGTKERLQSVTERVVALEARTEDSGRSPLPRQQ